MFTSLFKRTPNSGEISPVHNITASELKRQMESDVPVFLLDVRSGMEYQYDGHIAGARLLPLPALSQRLNEIPLDQTIVVVCRSGNRSMDACEILAAAGYKSVANLSSGMIGWQRDGFPVQR